MITTSDLVAHGPGGVDEAPVGGARDPVIGPPLVPVGRHAPRQETHHRQPH